MHYEANMRLLFVHLFKEKALSGERAARYKDDGILINVRFRPVPATVA